MGEKKCLEKKLLGKKSDWKKKGDWEKKKVIGRKRK